MCVCVVYGATKLVLTIINNWDKQVLIESNKGWQPVCGLCPTSPSLLGVCEYINSSATLIATSSFGVRVLLYVCVLSKNKK